MSKAFSPLSKWVQDFFWQRLQAQQQVSPHTISSYRDTLRLLVAFVEKVSGRPGDRQTLADWGAPMILQFLDHLEKERNCHPRTRNARLAALRALMRYLVQQAPEALETASQVLAIPFKRFDRRLVEPLSVAEVNAILAATDQTTYAGRRDHLLFNLLYHTGARVSEALNLKWQDVRWGHSSVVCFHGKGRKERTVPLLKPISEELKRMLAANGGEPGSWVFRNRFGGVLSRSGVEKRLRRTVRTAAKSSPSLAKRSVSAHVFRHTTAMGLLQAGVDITVIALLLGHESPNTTHHYVELDLHMKERALKKLPSSKNKSRRFKPTGKLLSFLNAL